jgi:hypothetical protein
MDIPWNNWFIPRRLTSCIQFLTTDRLFNLPYQINIIHKNIDKENHGRLIRKRGIILLIQYHRLIHLRFTSKVNFTYYNFYIKYLYQNMLNKIG